MKAAFADFKGRSADCGHLYGRASGYVALLLCMALVASACGGSGDGDPEAFPPIADSDSSGSSISAVESDTAVNPTSTSSPTTTQDPVSTPATDPVTGKPDLVIPTEWDSDLDEIFGRYLLYWEALDIAMGAPAATPNYEPLRDLTEESVFEEVQGQIQEFRDTGTILVYREDSISDHVLRLPNPAVLIKTEGNEVIIQDCWVDDSQVETLDGEVQATYLDSVLRNVTMKVIDGEWRLWASIDASEESDGYVECEGYIDEVS